MSAIVSERNVTNPPGGRGARPSLSNRGREPGSGSADGEIPIGEMAREFDVSLRTLRFYEDRGLLAPRRDGTARYYSAKDQLRLRMILKGKHLGFTLAEISDLIGASAEAPEAEFEQRLQPQQIASQIGHLERQKAEIDDALGRLRATYQRLETAPAPAA